MKKKNIVLLVSFLTALTSFSLLYFLLPFEKKDLVSHILCYFCFLATLVIPILFMVFPLRKNNDAEKLVLSLPLIKTVSLFSLIGLLLTIAEYVINIFVPVPFYVPLVVTLILISIFVIIFSLKKSNIEHIRQNETIREQSTCRMKELRRQSLMLVNLSKDDTTRTNRAKLSDRLRYSDPVANEKTEEIEKKILNLLAEYQAKIENNQKISDIQEAMNRIQERNVLCERNKK